MTLKKPCHKMNHKFKKNLFLIYLFFLLIITFPLTAYDKSQLCDTKIGFGPVSPSKSLLIEDFENLSDWQTIKLKNEHIKLSLVKGISGKALHIDYDLHDTGTWVHFKNLQKNNVDFSKDFIISFYIKAKAKDRLNELQFQFVDADGGIFVKAYWSGVKTSDWHKKEFHISELTYGWGGKNKTFDPPFTIGFTIARGNNSITGGKGWLEIDKLEFNNIKPHLELSINQIGFNPYYNKTAVIKLRNYDKKIKSSLDYKIVSLSDNKVIKKGKVKSYKKKMWNAQYWLITFKDIKKAGKYKLISSLKIKNKILKVESYPFEIKKDILMQKLGEPLFYYIKATRYPTNLKHHDPVPGGYYDTEFDMEKWMTTIPTWQWGMSQYYNLLKDKRSFKGYDPLDEIKFATKFGIDMQDKEKGGIYLGVNGKIADGKIWPFDVTVEEDTVKRFLNTSINIPSTTAYIIGTAEAAKAVMKTDPRLAKKYIKSADFACEYLSKQKFFSAEDIGMSLWGSILLYNLTKEKKYLIISKKYAKKLLPLQFLDYKRNDQKVFGKFFSNNFRNDFNYQYKFVNKMGMLMGLLELAKTLRTDDPLRKKLMFHLDCFAYGYIKTTAELNPYGLIAQALEPDDNSDRINLFFMPSPNCKIPNSYHGFNCDIMAMGIISIKYAKLTKNPLFARIAVDQLDWVLGKNPLGFNMVIGTGNLNPDSYHNEFKKGPIRGAIVNGFVAKEDGNIPVWGPGAYSQEYWKPHSAMMLALIAEIETDLSQNPFKYPAKKFNINKLYKKIDQYLAERKTKIKGFSFYNKLVTWQENTSDNILFETSFVKGRKNNAIKINYTSEKAGAWGQIELDARGLIKPNSKLTIWLKSSQSSKATLEIKLLDKDGTTYMKKIPCQNIPPQWHKINFKLKDFKYAWGKDKDLGKIISLQIAIATASPTSGFVIIDKIE